MLIPTYAPSFLAKEDVRNTFIAGRLATFLRSVYVARESVDDRNIAVSKIKERID